MELTPRLWAIAQRVPQGARLADVGTDHGYLPVWLLLNGHIEMAIAADLRKGPLDRAKETARQYRQGENISFRLCDGLTGITADEVDTVVIAGMGGDTVSAILEATPWTCQDKLLLLQPMTGMPQLRQWLQSHGYAILNEQIAREGKRLYSIWCVKGGWMAPLSPAELWAGKNNHDPLRLDYLTLIEEKAKRALLGQQSARIPNQAAIVELETILSGLYEMKKELNPDVHSG